MGNLLGCGRLAVLLIATVLTPVIGVGIGGQGAFAQSAAQTYQFNIPAKPIRQAMNDIVRITGIDLVFPETSAASATGRPVRGSMTSSQAVAALLSDTGLSYRFINASTVTISDRNAEGDSAATGADGSLMLKTIEVDGISKVLGAPPAPYAGGQVATGARLGVLGNRDIMDTPFNVTSYTEKTIQDQQARSVGDVVKNDPSVRTTWADGSYSNQFFIRGFSFGNPDMTINGLYGLAPYQMAGTSWIDRVEILKGPGALLNGMAPGGSIGGVVNLVPKRATDDPITRLSVGYISDSQFGAGVDLSRRFGDAKEFGVRFIAKVEAQPDITMPDLAMWLEEHHTIKADTSNLSKLLCRAGFTFTKTLMAAERARADVRKERDEWREHRQPAMQKSPGRLVFVDETSIKTNMTPIRGRSRKGERLQADAPFGKWNTQTFIAGLRCDAITAPFVVDGAMDGEKFDIYVRTQLAPTLTPRDVVIWDNLNVHKSPRAAAAIAEMGAWVLFLPRYSPDMNPIERAFSKLKTLLRKAKARTYDDLWKAVGKVCGLFSPQECWNYFKAAGCVAH